MTDRQVHHAAEFVAAHAVLLLGAAVVAALASLAAVLGIVRLLDRYRGTLERGVRVAVRYLRGIEMVDWSVQRARGLVPTGYLALHLTFGLALTAAVSGFVVIAEDVVGGGELAAFDVAFARALQEATTPAWLRFFAAVSWFGEREVVAIVAAAVAVWLLVKNDLVLAGGWIAAQAAGGLLNLALKEAFERTRPEFADPALAASSWSFPSGHVMGTFIVVALAATSSRGSCAPGGPPLRSSPLH